MKKEGNKKVRIIFMGTPGFAVPSLKAILDEGHQVVGVITAADKPAGRGKKLQAPAVKQFALAHGLRVLQPEKLKDEGFIRELRALQADLQVVVAFRMLPVQVWDMPPLGTFNLHASLLPQYRGAAPINHAIINGEQTTGLTTFFLDKLIDTGKIILRQEINIGADEDAGSLHDRMMIAGADLVVKTIDLIRTGRVDTRPQSALISPDQPLHPAPKIFKADCKINWEQPLDRLHNFVRGLSPHPTAYTRFVNPDTRDIQVKIFKTSKEEAFHDLQTGKLLTDGKQLIKVAVRDGYLHILELQQAGKKRMPAGDFLRGNPLTGDWKVI